MEHSYILSLPILILATLLIYGLSIENQSYNEYIGFTKGLGEVDGSSDFFEVETDPPDVESRTTSGVINAISQEHPKETEKPLNCTSNLGTKGQFNLIPLLSLPGSGNTWTRFL